MKREEFDYRPVREQPIATDAEVVAMLERLRRKGWGHKVKVTIKGSGVDQSSRSREFTAPEVSGANPTAVAPSPTPGAPIALLQWGNPMRLADGSGVIRTLCQHYSVCKERSGDRWRYVAFSGSHALGASESLTEAQALAQRSADNGDGKHG
jgi:hypothetical protein